MKAGLGGSIHLRRARKSGWLPKGIMDSSTQKMDWFEIELLEGKRGFFSVLGWCSYVQYIELY